MQRGSPSLERRRARRKRFEKLRLLATHCAVPTEPRVRSMASITARTSNERWGRAVWMSGQLMHGGDLGEIAWAFLARRLRAVKSRRLRRFAAGRVSFLTSDDRTAPRAQNVTAASR